VGTILPEARASHLDSCPDERELLVPFLAGFDVTWAAHRRVLGSELSFYFLRPERFMQEAFGFDNEILAVYSGYETLQARTMQAVEQFMSGHPAKGRVDNMIVFIISEAQTPEAWIAQYLTNNPEARIFAVFQATALRGAKGNSWYVRSVLGNQLYQRDLFDYRLPLRSDAYFFGRENLLFEFHSAVRRGENRGLFGLRKTGKTSLLYKLERLIRQSGSGRVFYYDCKYPAIRSLRWHALLGRIAREVLKSFRLTRPRKMTYQADEFVEAITACRPENPIVLIFDEVEYISPLSPLDAHWERDFIPFWQTIWACQSRRGNLCVIIAGINPTVVEKDRVGRAQNPLFGIVPFHYLKGLAEDEVSRMVRTLGRPMGLKFEPSAVAYLTKRYGGHPLLTRIACSLVHRGVRDARMNRPFRVTAEYLQKQEDTRDAELSFYCRHVVSELREFYHDEYELLTLLATRQTADFLEFTREPEFSRHLKNYGLLSVDTAGRPKIAIPVVAHYVALEAAREQGWASPNKPIDKTERLAWLRRRIEEIDRSVDTFCRALDGAGLPRVFGPASYPHSHKFHDVPVCDTEQQFAAFINICNKCFVESVDAYGADLGKSDYFNTVVSKRYPALAESLERIRVYRHHRVHIRLRPGVNKRLQQFLQQDLGGRAPSQIEDLWFVLQQRVLDELLVALLVEIDKIT